MKEKHDFFNAPPAGFIRTGQGWLQPAPTPQKRQLDKMKVENKELTSRLEQLEAMVEQLTNTKKKK